MQQCSEADADLLRGIAFEYIEAVCIGFFTVEYVSWMHIRYSETMKWHNLEHQSSWIMRFCESCWHGALDVKFRAVFGKYVEITVPFLAAPGFGDWSKYIKISASYQILSYQNISDIIIMHNVYIHIISYPILFRLSISPSGLDFLLLFDTLNTECSLWMSPGCPRPKSRCTAGENLLPVKLFMDIIK